MWCGEHSVALCFFSSFVFSPKAPPKLISLADSSGKPSSMTYDMVIEGFNVTLRQINDQISLANVFFVISKESNNHHFVLGIKCSDPHLQFSS